MVQLKLTQARFEDGNKTASDEKEVRKMLEKVKREGEKKECYVTEIVKLRKCSAWHFVKGAEEQFLSSLILCQKEERQMTA